MPPTPQEQATRRRHELSAASAAAQYARNDVVKYKPQAEAAAHAYEALKPSREA